MVAPRLGPRGRRDPDGASQLARRFGGAPDSERLAVGRDSRVAQVVHDALGLAARGADTEQFAHTLARDVVDQRRIRRPEGVRHGNRRFRQLDRDGGIERAHHELRNALDSLEVGDALAVRAPRCLAFGLVIVGKWSEAVGRQVDRVQFRKVWNGKSDQQHGQAARHGGPQPLSLPLHHHGHLSARS